MNRGTVLSPFVFLLSLRGQDAALEHARAVNLERAANLPNFVADETSVRYKSPHIDPPQWQLVDTIESEIAVQGGAGFTRQHVRVNGQPWNKPELPGGFRWSVQFGAELKQLFGPGCPTRIEFEGREEVFGKSVLAYRYSSPPNGCFGFFEIKNGLFSFTKRYNPARKGRFLINEADGSVIRFEGEADEFPKGFGADPWTTTVSWDYVKTGDGTHLLPVAMDIFGGFVKADLWHVTVEYKNHRHFQASTHVTFRAEKENAPK